MKVIVEARRFTLRNELKEYTENAVQKLDRFFDRIMEVEVTYEGKGHQKEAALKVSVSGSTLVASEVADKFEVALDAALEKMEKQLKKYKEKLRAKR